MMNCRYQLLLVLSLFVVVRSTDVTTISEEAVTSTTRKPYLRSLWTAWTVNSSPSTNVGTTNANAANGQQQSASRCSLCHDGSYPKNPNHGVTVGFTLYSFQGTCSNLYYDLLNKVYSTDQICNPLQDHFDWPCGCNANYQPPQAPVGSINQNKGYGTWNVGGP